MRVEQRIKKLDRIGASPEYQIPKREKHKNDNDYRLIFGRVRTKSRWKICTCLIKKRDGKAVRLALGRKSKWDMMDKLEKYGPEYFDTTIDFEERMPITIPVKRKPL